MAAMARWWLADIGTSAWSGASGVGPGCSDKANLCEVARRRTHGTPGFARRAAHRRGDADRRGGRAGARVVGCEDRSPVAKAAIVAEMAQSCRRPADRLRAPGRSGV